VVPESVADSASVGIGNAEAYGENRPEPLTSPTVHTVNAITKVERIRPAWQGGLADAQITDKEIGALVAMRLCSNTAPPSDEV